MNLRLALSLGTAAFLTLASLQTKAATPQFSNLSQSDLEKVVTEFTANSSWHSATTPSALGSIFGFELGVVGGITKTPDMDAIAKQASPSADVKMIPHAALVGGVTLPFSITVEALFLPKVSVSGIDYQQFGGALKWTPSDGILSVLPVNLAVRGFLAKSTLSFKQTITDTTLGIPVDATVNADTQVMGAQLLASPKLIPILEPYIGLGYLSGKGSLALSGVTSSQFFASGAMSADAKPTSTQILVGLEARLFLIAFAAEYERSFGKDMFTGKMSFKF